MTKRVCVFSGSLNPLGLHHFEIAGLIAEAEHPTMPERFFDEVILRPCGFRPDQDAMNGVDFTHRAAMAGLAMQYPHHPNISLDLSDFERPEFQRTFDLDQELRQRGFEVWHAVSSNLLESGYQERSVIHGWHRGSELWRDANFLVLKRAGCTFLSERNLPPHAVVLKAETLPEDGLGGRIRGRAYGRRSLCEMVHPEVERYIYRHGIYSHDVRRNPGRGELDLSRPFIVMDGRYASPRALELAALLGYPTTPIDRPTCIFVLGGDGTMMHAVREHWQRHVPFFGINAGHRGFHLNEMTNEQIATDLKQRMKIYHQPMLRVEWMNDSGALQEMYAYQDAWLSGQKTPLNISVEEGSRLKTDLVTRYERLVGDAAIVALPVGSTGYARSAGAQPFPVTVPVLSFAVSAFNDYSSPQNYRPRALDFDATFRFKNLQPERRWPELFVDGQNMGVAHEVNIRVSRIASAQVAYLPGHDFSAKL